MALAKRTGLHKDRSQRALALVHLRLYDDAHRRAVRVSPELRNLCDNEDVLQQVVNAHAVSG